MSDPIVAKEAAALRAALAPYNPLYADLSDGDVIRRASTDDALVGPATKKRLQETFGDSPVGAAVRGVARGVGMDIAPYVTPALLGAEWLRQKFAPSIPGLKDLNEPVLADDTAMSVGGNIAGSV